MLTIEEIMLKHQKEQEITDNIVDKFMLDIKTKPTKKEK